jgi:hypothetical protein
MKIIIEEIEAFKLVAENDSELAILKNFQRKGYIRVWAWDGNDNSIFCQSLTKEDLEKELT